VGGAHTTGPLGGPGGGGLFYHPVLRSSFILQRATPVRPQNGPARRTETEDEEGNDPLPGGGTAKGCLNLIAGHSATDQIRVDVICYVYSIWGVVDLDLYVETKHRQSPFPLFQGSEKGGPRSPGKKNFRTRLLWETETRGASTKARKITEDGKK